MEQELFLCRPKYVFPDVLFLVCIILPPYRNILYAFKAFFNNKESIKINNLHLFIFYKYQYTTFLFPLLVVYCRYGVLAQLGARNIRIVEATGSNPVYSISKKHQEPAIL